MSKTIEWRVLETYYSSQSLTRFLSEKHHLLNICLFYLTRPSALTICLRHLLGHLLN